MFLKLFLVYTLGHNAYGQCGRGIVEGEIFRGNETVNKIPIDINIKQVITIGDCFCSISYQNVGGGIL